MFNKLAFAAILGASYATTAEAAGSCLAKDDNAWAAIGLTVTTAAATDVSGLGAIGAAAGWSEDSTDSADAVCDGGVASFASLPAITAGTGSAGTASSITTNSGSGTGLVANVEVTDADNLASITVTTAGTGYLINDVLTFPEETGGTGNHAEFTYTLVAADFAPFTASGVTANPKCDDTDGSGADFAACGSGFTIKSNLDVTCAGATCQVSDCCTANPKCDDTDGSGADFAACGSGFTIKSNLDVTCAGATCQVSDCCDADATTTTGAPAATTTGAPAATTTGAPAATTTTAPVDATTTPKPKDDHKDHDHSPSPATVDAASTMTPASLVTVASILIAYMMH